MHENHEGAHTHHHTVVKAVKALGWLGARWSQTQTQGIFGISPSELRLWLFMFTLAATAAAAAEVDMVSTPGTQQVQKWF